MQQLAVNLRQFNAKYWPELGGNCPSPTTNWYQSQTNGWGGWARGCQNNGIIWSEFTHDYHMENMEPVCQANPTWPNNDQIAWWTGDLTVASGAYPYTSGIWRDTFNGYYLMFPQIKVGHTSSPVWWGWDAYPALYGNNLAFTVTNSSGQNLAFSFTAHAIVASFVNMASAINRPYFAFQSDCPWDYFGFNGTLSTGAQNREKIRAYEQYLQSRGARHTLICNVSNAGNQGGGNDAQDLYYMQSSLKSMFTHQREGGRANRYLFESWYFGIPHAVVPESKSGSYCNLALNAIKYPQRHRGHQWHFRTARSHAVGDQWHGGATPAPEQWRRSMPAGAGGIGRRRQRCEYPVFCHQRGRVHRHDPHPGGLLLHEYAAAGRRN